MKKQGSPLPILLILLVFLIFFILFAIFFAPYEFTSHSTATAIFTDNSENVLAHAELQISDTFLTRYIGLSHTDHLEQDQGMLFIHPTEKNHTYVMRNMDFPIDIIFIDSKGTIVSIHHAYPESPPYSAYEGFSKLVLELPHNWTIDNNISVGDTVSIHFD